MDEENIVRRMINGDMDAFGELMEKYERPALRAAWLVSGGQRGHCPGDIHRLLFKQKEAPGSGSL